MSDAIRGLVASLTGRLHGCTEAELRALDDKLVALEQRRGEKQPARTVYRTKGLP